MASLPSCPLCLRPRCGRAKKNQKFQNGHRLRLALANLIGTKSRKTARWDHAIGPADEAAPIRMFVAALQRSGQIAPFWAR